MRLVRIRFTKTGAAKYISHLDLTRCMTRAVRRAGIPLWYTEGFNPHPYMTFTAPLPLGVESLCEAMDVKIVDDTPCDVLVEKLSAVMPRGIAIVSADDNPSDFSLITCADYTIVLNGADGIADRISRVLSGDSLPAMKSGKAGRKKVMKEINLIDYVRSFSVTGDTGEATLQIRLDTGNVRSTNPLLLLDALAKATGENFRTVSLCRTALFTDEGEFH